MIVGLTGRVGSGKSTAAQILQSRFGAIVIDLDTLGHHSLEFSPIKQQIIHAFGNRILDPTGEIDRSKLGKIVFSDPLALTQLNQIVHPHIRQEVEMMIQADPMSETIFVIVGALIEEIGLRPLCNPMIVIDAEDAEIKKQIGDKFDRISPHQRSRTDYLSSATIAIPNHFTDHFENQIVQIFSKLLE